MTLRKMSAAGDEPVRDGNGLVCEWDATTSQERIAEIEKEFNELTKAGYWAADITAGKEPTIIHKFDAKADILLGPKLQGG